MISSIIPHYQALANGSHQDAIGYAVVDGALQVSLNNGSTTGLAQADKLAGYKGGAASPSAVLMEAALTTIMDCEDSVAAVDAADKTLIYSNWLGLMKGDLTEQVSKGGKTFIRAMNLGLATQHPESRHHGRRAPHHRQPERVHPHSQGTCRVH